MRKMRTRMVLKSLIYRGRREMCFLEWNNDYFNVGICEWVSDREDDGD